MTDLIEQDVYRVSNYLRHEIPLDYAGAEEAAEMLERLWRENEKLKGVIHFQNHGSLNTITEDETADFIDKQRQTIEAQQQRIEELTEKHYYAVVASDHLVDENKRLDAALAEIENNVDILGWAPAANIARKARAEE